MTNMYPRFLWLLIISYAMTLIMANWFDARLIEFFHLTTDAGTLIFPFTFLFSDLITEVYGYKYARLAIWVALIFNLCFIGYGQLVAHLPSPAHATNNALFDQVLVINARIVIASLVSYLFSEPLNCLILAKLKIRTQGRLVSLRFFLSTLIAGGVDSFIFGALAFYGTMHNSLLLIMILTMWAIKVVIELIGLPLSVYLSNKIKQAEHIDIYDTKTNFSMFSLDTKYLKGDNRY